MIRLDDVLVLTPQITPTAARIVVIASYKAAESVPIPPLDLVGQVIGPSCEYATTLSGRVPLPTSSMNHTLKFQAAVQILEPCFWEPQHPFCYEIQLELHKAGKDDRLLDMRRVICGIRHLAVDGLELLLNGQPFFLQGLWHDRANSITELERWHQVGCDGFLADANGLCDRTDRWGPFALHVLAPVIEEAKNQVVRLRNHPSLGIWVVPDELTGTYLDSLIKAVSACDRSRPIAQMVSIDLATSRAGPADILLLPASHPEIGSDEIAKPYIAVARSMTDAAAAAAHAPDGFSEAVADFRDSLGSPPGLVGVIV